MIATVLDQAADQLGAFLPRFVGALVLLIVGLIVAAIAGRMVRAALTRLGVDRVSERWDIPQTLERAGLGQSLARLSGRAIRIGLTVVVVFAALSLLGLEFLSQSLNEGVLFLPRLLTAAALVLFGVVLAALARERTERSTTQMNLPVSIGVVVQALVLILFGLTAAAQLGVSISPLILFVELALAAFALTLTLAFGLGTRDVARALTSTRYVRGDFAVDETIRVGDIRGRIVQIGSAATTLETATGRVRVPNHLLFERMVIVETGDTGDVTRRPEPPS